MQTRRRQDRTFLFLVIGLLAFAGTGSGPGPALAQLDCPRPAGVTPLADPRVAARQVEDGSASLMDFALAARDQWLSVVVARSPGLVPYLNCLVRQEGSPWRSGSTYLVLLTLDGRVFVHAEDMSLSGRQLNPVIYGAVLGALGISPAVLSDPAAGQATLAAAAAGDGGRFDVPGIPGASGYATAYFEPSVLRQPLVVLAGFELDSSHLADEDIEHVEPAVAARDVVGRATLKAFVTAAGEHFIGLRE